MGIRVGIDTGGTFTDLVAVDESTGEWYVAKVPSNPARPVEALAAVLEQAQFDPADVTFVVVGTTIGINAVLTRTGARVLYLTTKGFEDVPFIQRINRKNHYDFHWRKPDAARAPAATASASPSGSTRRAGARAARPRRRCGESLAETRAGRRGRRGRGLLPVLATSIPSTSCAARDAARRARSRPAGLALARDRADLARVRARHDDDRRRVPEAARSSATSAGVDEALARAGRRGAAGRC